MNTSTEILFTAALGLQAPWRVHQVELSTAKHRIDFEVVCDAQRLSCPLCGHAEQPIHDRIRRSWRHLDFFQYKAWLHADVPRVRCGACGKTTQIEVPWAREGSGFTLLFEALALTLCKELPVAQAASQLRVQGHRLWRRIQHYVKQALPQAVICYDRFHVAALAGKAMGEVRSAEFKTQARAVGEALGELEPKARRCLAWAMRTHHERWSQRHMQAMYVLQRTHLKSARAWRLKVALRQVYEAATQSQSVEVATEGLRRWVSWARRSRLEPFKRLAKTLSEHWDGVLAGMLKARTNAFVEAMNGLLQQAKRAARGFRTTENFIAMAYLRMSKLQHLPESPFVSAVPRNLGIIRHRL